MKRGSQYHTLAKMFVLAYLGVVVAIIAMFVFAPPAAGHEMQCMPAGTMRAALSNRFSERIEATGTAGESLLAELWVNEETRSWTLLMVTTDGMACAAAAGDGWEAEPPPTAPTREG